MIVLMQRFTSIFYRTIAASVLLRGCFLTCSSITDPEKEYHLEFVVLNDRLSDDLLTLMNDIGIHAKATKRKGINIIYLKESENIEDLLTLMGAMKSTLELMNVKIYKDVRNKVNRVTNCETANIGKTVVASSNQIKDIEWIAEHEGLDYLPDELRQVAELRLIIRNYPYPSYVKFPIPV